MRYLLAGSSGFLGTALRVDLAAQGHQSTRLVRRPAATATEWEWDPDHGSLDPAAFDGVDAVVNLCGVGIADRQVPACRSGASSGMLNIRMWERLWRMAISPDRPEPADDLQTEYDFRSLQGVVRGKYATRYRERLRVARLAADVAAAFEDETAVNAALREYLRCRPQTRSEGSAREG